MRVLFGVATGIGHMPRVERLRVYPVKGLDGIDRQAARIDEWGTLELDRSYALLDDAGTIINGKRTADIHRVSASFDPEGHLLTIATDDIGPETVSLAETAGRERAGELFGTVFDRSVRVVSAEPPAVDRPEMGPSVISTATLEAVADWFESISVDGARRRFRANIEVSGVPAFWEDRFVASDAPDFAIDGVRFEGVTPCGRCVVPTRDPDTGESIDGFRERFVDRREASRPEWVDDRAFDQDYSLMILTDVPDSDRGEVIETGDTVTTIERNR